MVAISTLITRVKKIANPSIHELDLLFFVVTEIIIDNNIATIKIFIENILRLLRNEFKKPRLIELKKIYI